MNGSSMPRRFADLPSVSLINSRPCLSVTLAAAQCDDLLDFQERYWRLHRVGLPLHSRSLLADVGLVAALQLRCAPPGRTYYNASASGSSSTAPPASRTQDQCSAPTGPGSRRPGSNAS